MRSFGAVADSELTFGYLRNLSGAWELRHGDELVGVVDRPSELVRGEAGTWRVGVGRLLAWRLVFMPLEQPAPIATYVPRRLLPGGTITLSDERSYRLRPCRRFLAPGWTLSDAQGTELVRARHAEGRWDELKEWSFELRSGVADEPAGPLVVLATCYVILVAEEQRPWSSAGGGV